MNKDLKKLTITIDTDVYDGLHKKIGRGNIGKYVSDIVRPRVVEDSLERGYKEMSQDASYNAEAHQWIEGLLVDQPEYEW